MANTWRSLVPWRSLQLWAGNYPSVTVSFNVLFNDKAPVLKSLSARWNVINQPSRTLQFVWNQQAQTTKSQQFYWNNTDVINIKTWSGNWNILVPVSMVNRSYLWKDRLQISKNTSFVWYTTGTAFATISKNLVVYWNNRSLLTDGFISYWNNKSSVFSNKQFVWNNRVLISASYRSYLWNNNTISGVKNLTILFNTIQGTVVYTQFLWNVTGVIRLDRIYRWNSAIPVSSIRVFVWNNADAVHNEINLLWDTYRGLPIWTEIPRPITAWNEVVR